MRLKRWRPFVMSAKLWSLRRWATAPNMAFWDRQICLKRILRTGINIKVSCQLWIWICVARIKIRRCIRFSQSKYCTPSILSVSLWSRNTGIYCEDWIHRVCCASSATSYVLTLIICWRHVDKIVRLGEEAFLVPVFARPLRRFLAELNCWQSLVLHMSPRVRTEHLLWAKIIRPTSRWLLISFCGISGLSFELRRRIESLCKWGMPKSSDKIHREFWSEFWSYEDGSS